MVRLRAKTLHFLGVLHSWIIDISDFILPILKLRLVPSWHEWRTWTKQRSDILKNLNISLALDVGALRGEWFREFRNDGFHCPVWSFECDPRALEILNQFDTESLNWKIFPIALSDRSGHSEFFQWPIDTGQSSLLRTSPDNPYASTLSADVVPTLITVPMKRLDEVIDSNLLSMNRTLLKIDVQGAELDVLKGCGVLLQQFYAIEVEVSLVRFYENSEGLIESVISFLRDAGFEPLTIQTERFGGNNGTIAGGLDCDLLAVRRDLITKNMTDI